MNIFGFDVPTYTLLWVGWLLYFLAVEIPSAVDNNPGGTLSEHLWAVLGLGRAAPVPLGVRLRRIVMVCFTAWLLVHIFTGGWI